MKSICHVLKIIGWDLHHTFNVLLSTSRQLNFAPSLLWFVKARFISVKSRLCGTWPASSVIYEQPQEARVACAPFLKIVWWKNLTMVLLVPLHDCPTASFTAGDDSELRHGGNVTDVQYVERTKNWASAKTNVLPKQKCARNIKKNFFFKWI